MKEIIVLFIMVLLYIFLIFLIDKEIKQQKMKKLVVLSLTIRIILAVIDNYITFIPFSGADNLVFEYKGWLMSRDILSIKESYPKLISYIYFFTGRNPMFLSFLNIFSYCLGGLFLSKIFKILKIQRKSYRNLILLFYYFPISFFLTSITLRESFNIFTLIVSVFYFIKYIKKKNLLNLAFSISFLVFSSWLHGGVLLVSLGYVYYLITESNKNEKILNFLRKIFLILIIAISLVLILNSGMISKFDGNLEKKAISGVEYTLRNQGRIGSNYYVGGLNPSLGSIIKYLPINYYYFLFSPTLIHIKGLMDIIVFLLDSMIYFIIILTCFIKFKNLKSKMSKQNILLIKCLAVSFFITTLVFALGTFNYGTAIRHRNKLFFILLIIYALIMNYNNKRRRNNGIQKFKVSTK